MEGLARIGFGLFGLAVLIGVAWLFSNNRRAVDWKLVLTGIQIINKITDFKFEDWKKMLAIHLDGAFLTTRECMKDMERRKSRGAIILMGSVHSHVASPLKAPYVTAKHGLLGLARTIAKEGGPLGIRSNVICPEVMWMRLRSLVAAKRQHFVVISGRCCIAMPQHRDESFFARLHHRGCERHSQGHRQRNVGGHDASAKEGTEV